MSETQHIRQTPLVRAVAAAAVDMYEDFESVQARYFHWGARGVKQLAEQMLKRELRSAILRVNPRTYTATLPCGMDENGVLFVGIVNQRGEKVPLRRNNDLVDLSGVELPADETCPVCSQKKSICEELQASEEVTFVEINGRSYEQVVTKKLYPDGSYYLETNIPFYNQVTEKIEWVPDKTFVAKVERAECGCIENTAENRAVLQCACPDVYFKYFAPVLGHCSDDYGEYKILPESGLIQFSHKVKFAYIEYVDFLTKVNGQYFIPEPAFEALVEFIKWRSVKDRKGVERWTKLDHKAAFDEARSDLYIIINRVSLEVIKQASRSVPKFQIDWRRDTDCFCCDSVGGRAISLAPTENQDEKTKMRFSLSRIVGLNEDAPLNDTSIWHHPSLVNAEVEYMIVNNVPATRLSGAFTFDRNEGKIDWSPNKFNTGDVVIIPNLKIV